MPPSLLAVDPRGIGDRCFLGSPLRPGRSRRPQPCALLGLGRSLPPPSPGSLRQLTLPPLSCIARGHQGGGRDAARPPGTQPAALWPLSRAGSTSAGSPTCPSCPPLRESPGPSPALVFTWIIALACSVFTVVGHGWARMPLSSQPAWMMLLKHNNGLVCVLEFIVLKKWFEKVTSATKYLPGPNRCTGVGEACTGRRSGKNLCGKFDSLEACDLKQ